MARLISDGLVCPFPRPHYRAHRDDNAELVGALRAMTPDQQQAWLAERRKQRAALLATITTT
jgi:hypothetical protein